MKFSCLPSIDFLIGNNIAVGNHYFKGYIDDISLWSMALSQANIQSYLSSELNGNETGLFGYWNFNTGSGTTLIDQTSNSNNGTINGATWSTDVPTTSTTWPDADYQNVADQLIISWSGSDPASGIALYEYALGTTSGGTQAIPWTSAGTATADTLTGLSLTE